MSTVSKKSPVVPKRPLSERLRAKRATSGSSKSAPKTSSPSDPVLKSKRTKPPVRKSPSKPTRKPVQKSTVKKFSKKETTDKPLWKHQAKTLKFAKKRQRVFDASDPGTGKTRAHLESFALRRRQKGGALLVIAPKSLLQTAWQNDASEYVSDMSTSVAYASNREAAFAIKADIYITNTDAVKWLAKQPDSFYKRFDSVVVDESTTFKHRTSQRSKALNNIRGYFPFRTMMTGTPNAGSILNLFNQIFFLDDGVRLGNNFFKYRSAVCTPEQVGPSVNMLKWTDKDGAEEAVSGLIRDITIRHQFEDCMDIPPNHTYPVKYHMPNKLMNQYRELEERTILALQEDDVTAVNAAVLRNKLLQLASGAVYTSTGVYEILDKGRYELVLDLVEQRDHSIVFFNWRHQREQLVAEAERRGVTYEVLDGTTPDDKRTAIVSSYQAGRFQTLFLHPQTGAHGLTLTRGTACIFSSPIYEADYLKQGLHRVYRGGQTLPTETILIEAENTVEKKVYSILNGKNERMVNLLEMLKDE